MIKWEKVSIVISVYNGEEIIQQSIDSIIEQTYKNYEIILVDDNSSDGTTSVIEENMKKHKHIKLITNEKNQGLTKSLIKGIDHSQGTFIARLDAGDIMRPERLEKQVGFFNENPRISLLASKSEEILYEKGKKIYSRISGKEMVSKELKKELCVRNPIGHWTVMFRKKDYYSVGGYNSDFRVSQDYELWIRFLHKFEAFVMPEVLNTSIIYNESSITANRNREQMKNGMIMKHRAIKKGFLPFYPTVFGIAKSGLMLLLPVKINYHLRTIRARLHNYNILQ